MPFTCCEPSACSSTSSQRGGTPLASDDSAADAESKSQDVVCDRDILATYNGMMYYRSNAQVFTFCLFVVERNDKSHTLSQQQGSSVCSKCHCVSFPSTIH